MNGRMAKQLRRVAANPSIPEETSYKALQHKVVMYKPVTNKTGVQVYKDGKPAYEPVGIVRLQVVLDNCQRKLYKVWKARYRHFSQRSNTLPNTGFNVSTGG